MNRINTLTKILESEPNDSFSRYALGLEYVSLNDYDEAQKEFNFILRNDPQYLPVYYQLGKVLESTGDSDKALKIYQQGLYVASSQNDLHTKAELQDAIDSLY
ncbi:MAG TPA: tetratricopeptide repeat protein [Ignavibacteria bacterium]|nr:tetratricopeptide repeat protein [Ignavibacteria bacterium]